MILFTDKKQTPSIYKAISKDWKDKVELGEVKSIEKDIAGKFGVSEFPTLIGIVDSVSLVQGVRRVSEVRSASVVGA